MLGLMAYLTRGLWIGMLEGIFDRPHKVIVNDGKFESGNFPIVRNTSTVNFLDILNNDIVTADDSNIFIYGENGELINSFVHELPPREKQIMEMRFGMNGYQEYTQKEVADWLGISQSYISRLEKRIMLRLRKELVRQTDCV